MTPRRQVVCRIGWVAVAALLAAARPSQAQTRPASVRLPVAEIGGGVNWSGASALGDRDATFTANSAGTPPRSVFFKTDSELADAPRGFAWIGVNLSSLVGVEGAFQHGRPEMRTHIGGDAEAVANTTIATTLTESSLEGNVLFYGNGWRFDEHKTVPFVFVGAGVFRQERNDVASETGRLFQAGVGFKWIAGVRPNRRAAGPGIRLDVRYVFRDGGFDLGNDRPSYVAASATALLAF